MMPSSHHPSDVSFYLASSPASLASRSASGLPRPGPAAGPEGTSGRRLRVLAIDDHPAIREAIADTVEAQPDMMLCGVAESASEALKLVRRERPDVAVLDISLGDAHGLDLIEHLQAQHEALEIVVFSMYDEAVYAERAIRAGARGYVMKSQPTQSVVEAVRTAAQGGLYVSPYAATLLHRSNASAAKALAFERHQPEG